MNVGKLIAALTIGQVMDLGLVILPQPWSRDVRTAGATLRRLAITAEEGGFASLWSVDHLLPPPEVADATEPMLEAYATLGYLAAATSEITLGTLVTGVTQRHPGHLAKVLTSLDVLSGGRAVLGIGAAWFAYEHAAMGVPFPPLLERFERLEETIRILRQMWSDDDGPFAGRHYRLEATINHPRAPVAPPLLIGGSGRHRTMLLVARYADACCLFPDTIVGALDSLREHCAAVGRDYEEIAKTVYYRMDVGPRGTRVDETIEELHALAELGADTALCEVRGYDKPGNLEIVAERVLPAVARVRSSQRSEHHHGLEHGAFVHGPHRRGQLLRRDV
jgi:F420-dependent oxidoreductase-like protein